MEQKTSASQERDKLRPIANREHGFLLEERDVQKGFDITALQLGSIVEGNSERFREGVHFVLANKERLWSKKGALKLAFFVENDKALKFAEFLEELTVESPASQSSASTKNIISIYKTIEKKFVKYAQEIENNEEFDAGELKKFIETFNMFVATQRHIAPSISPPDPHSTLGAKKGKNGFLNNLYNLATKSGDDAMKFASNTRDTAYNFASKTEDDAFRFATKTEDDAFTFTQDTRDLAYQFASKTEDDAFKFASKMEEDAYQFASKGMDYGYMFTTQGEELGPMADRILWMASEIGTMADRIGEMADRIVHTEHLIVNTSILILNFGLLIDGTIKTLTEAGLNAMSMAMDKELKPLTSSQKHLDVISENIRLILQQQHEYDMKVLDNQKELRDKTNSSLDYIKYEY